MAQALPDNALDVRTTANAYVRFAHPSGSALDVRRFEVREAMNEHFEIKLRCVVPNESIDLSELVGTAVRFELRANVRRVWTGLCREMRFLRVSETAEGLATYELCLVPWLWRTTQRSQSRMFQHQPIPEMVTAILKEWNIAHQWRIATSRYQRLELRTQYHETDYAFLSRLLEEAGICFWFEPGDDDASVMVLGDAPQEGAERATPLTFVDESTLARAGRGEIVTNLSLAEVSRTGQVVLRDYDHLHPRFPLIATAVSGRQVEAAHEEYVFDAHGFVRELQQRSPDEMPLADNLGAARAPDRHGTERARLRLEAIHAERRVVACDTSVIDLEPGAVWRLLNHPRPDLAPHVTLLAIRGSLVGEVTSPDTWRFRCESVHTDHPYRPVMRHDKPRMYGIQSAVVVGPSPNAPRAATDEGLAGTAPTEALAFQRLIDNEIHVDEHGRVRVQFHWDRQNGFGDESSVWMRVSQGWAGAGYGLFTVPRVGHEVLVAYLDGDPDAPLIIGRVHNAREPVPFALPKNKTVSTWRTATSPGGGGFNELRFDDAAGREHVYLQAERDMDCLVKHDAKHAVGANRTSYVQRDETVGVGKDRIAFVNQNDFDATGLNRVSSIGVNRNAYVGSEDNTVVGTRWAVTVGRGLPARLGAELNRAAAAVGDVLRASAGSTLATTPNDPLTPTHAHTLSSLGQRVLDGIRDVLGFGHGAPVERGPLPTSIAIHDRHIALTTGEASIIMDGPNVMIQAAGNITFHAGGHIASLAEKEQAIAAGERMAIVSDTDDVILQANKTIQLNPYKTSDARETLNEVPEMADEQVEPGTCVLCRAPLTTDNGITICSSHAGDGAAEATP